MPSDSPWINRYESVSSARCRKSRRAIAAWIRLRKNSLSTGSSVKVQARARICECGEYEARARKIPLDESRSTVDPETGFSSTDWIALAKIHGCRRSRDFSLVGL